MIRNSFAPAAIANIHFTLTQTRNPDTGAQTSESRHKTVVTTLNMFINKMVQFYRAKCVTLSESAEQDFRVRNAYKRSVNGTHHSLFLLRLMTFLLLYLIEEADNGLYNLLSGYLLI